MSSNRNRRRNQRLKQNVLDAAAQAIENQNPTTDKKLTSEIATRTNSIDFIGSILGSLPNPDPVLKKLGRDIQVYEDLLYDSRVTATTESRKSAVKAMEWDIVGEGVPEAEIDFYTELFKSYPMRDTISEILDAPLFGYKPLEIIWRKDGAQIVPLEFVGKPPRWFRYDDDNQLRMLTRSNMFEGELLPPNKFIVARREPTYDNPYGKPALSSCFWPVTFRKNGFKFWTIFLEKYGAPFLIAKAPEGAKETEINQVADMLQDMVVDAIAVVPKEYEISIEESSEGKGKADSLHKVYLDTMNVEIAMAILGTNLTTEVQGGSFAASQSHMEVRADIIESDQRIVENTFNQLIKMTHVLNFQSTIVPKFHLFAEEDVDETRSKRDVNLKNTGVRFTKEYYQKNYNLQEDDFEVVGESEAVPAVSV